MTVYRNVEDIQIVCEEIGHGRWCKAYISYPDLRSDETETAYGISIVGFDQAYITPGGGLIYVDGDVDIERYFDPGIEGGAHMLRIRKIH